MTGPRLAQGRTNGNGNVRPRVLLADDHPLVLESVSLLLADEFEIVAAVSDGRQALDAALRLRPDVAVLDITMPVLDGLRATTALRRAGLDTRVVFLTMHQEDDYVAAAIAAGADGYVVKTRIQMDLRSAVRHVCAGRRFLPSLSSLSAVSVAASTHAAQIYGDTQRFVKEIGGLVMTSLQRGDVVAIVGTEELRNSVAGQLRARGIDPDRHERYKSYDAPETLAQLMRDGSSPNRDRLAEMIDSLERSRAAAGPSTRLTALGEMSSLLYLDGQREAAVQIEESWTDLTRNLPFLTVCGYSAACFHDEGHAAFTHVCDTHSAVCHV